MSLSTICLMFFAVMPNEYSIPGVVDVVLEHPIYLDYDEAMFGISMVPNATITTEDKVFVNKAFLSLPHWAKEAIVAHEIGHRQFGHFSSIMERIDAVSMGYVHENELLADEYSASLVGHDNVVNALALMYHIMLATPFAPRYLEVIIMSEIWMRVEEISRSSVNLMSPVWSEYFIEVEE